MNEIKITKLNWNTKGRNRPAVYLVTRDGKELGMLEKYNSTPAEDHPWKAYLGIGMGREFLGAFYTGPDAGNGRTNAIRSIIDRS